MSVVKFSAILLAIALTAGPSIATAQLFDFFGGGGHDDDHHHHDAAGHRVDDFGHHIDNHGNHTGAWGVFDGDHSNEPHYSNSRPTYVRPSYTQPRTTYYSPSPSTYVTPNALPRPVQPAYLGEPIEIKFPATIAGSVNYALNEHKYAIGSGQSQVIQSDRSWVISFDRGGDFGLAKYSLSPGTYQFTVTEKGWELQKQRPPQPQVAAAPAAPAPAPPGPAANPIPTLNSGVVQASNTTPVPTPAPAPAPAPAPVLAPAPPAGK